MDPTLAGLRTQFRHAVADDPWHGPALVRLLDGISATAAAAHPIAGGHSIWETVLHVAAWHREVLHRLDGHPPGLPAEGDWPVAGTDAEAWDATVADLLASLAELDAALARLAPDTLARPVGLLREPSLGTGVTLGETLLGLLQHDAYHGGQIALLRRALGIAS